MRRRKRSESERMELMQEGTNTKIEGPCGGQGSGKETHEKTVETQLELNREAATFGDALKVRAKGTGLTSAHVNQYAVFQLDATKAGYGDADVVIKGPSKATITFVEEAEAFYRVHYMVTLPGDYFIEIRFNENHIPGSPFPLYIGFDRSGTNSLAGSIQSLENMEVGGMTDFDANIFSFESPKHVNGRVKRELENIPPLEVKIESPSGNDVKGKLVYKADKSFAVTFPHPEIGKYLVHIFNTRTEKAIKGSPFKVYVNEIPDKDVVRVSGKAFERCRLGETGIVRFETSGILNPADLVVAFEGNIISSLKAVQSDTSSLDFLFVPKKPGIMRMHANHNGSLLVGSPFKIRVTSSSLMTSKYESLPTSTSTEYSKFIVWVGSQTNDPIKTSVFSPCKRKVEHTLIPFDQGSFELCFSGKEVGDYRVVISTVGFKEPVSFLLANTILSCYGNELYDVKIDYETVCIVGQRYLLSLSSGAERIHRLSVEFKGPGKINTEQVIENDKVLIYYQGKTPGKYKINVNKDGIPVAESPWRFAITDAN